MRNNGNALFLILIAVALFAALSYAVTNSGRGGGDISREDAEIQVAQILNDLASYKAGIDRLKVIGGYDEVLFDDVAENNSDTCYRGSATITPCRTVGLFSEDGLVNADPISIPEWRHPAQDYSVWYWYIHRVREAGAEVGSEMPDRVVWLEPLPLEVCKAINRRLHGEDDPFDGTAITSFTGDTRGSLVVSWRSDTGFTARVDGGTDTSGEDFPYASGCYDFSGWDAFQYIIEEN